MQNRAPRHHRWYLPAVLTLGLLVGGAAAQTQAPVYKARSANDRFVANFKLGQTVADARSAAEVTLFAQQADLRMSKRWRVPLVNERGPLAAVLHPTGRYLVTFDELDVGGVRHALVVYDSEGRLQHHLPLYRLLSREQWSAAEVTADAIVWRGRGSAQFLADDRLAIPTREGGRVTVDLIFGRVIEPSTVAALGEIPAAARALLFGDAAAEAVAAAADTGADRAAERPGVSNEKPREVVDTEERAEPPLMVREAPDEPAPAEPAAVETGQQDADVASAAGDTERDGPPLPRLDQPRDYVAWINASFERPQDGGPNLNALTPWKGSATLQRRAMRGFDSALEDPELQAWLKANAEPLEAFRSAVRQGTVPNRYRASDGAVLVLDGEHLDTWRELARAVLIEAQRRQRAGEFTAAVEGYLDAAAAGIQLATGATVQETLAGANVVLPAQQGILKVLANPQLTASQAGVIAERLTRIRARAGSFADVIAREQALAYAAIQALYTTGSDGTPAIDREQVKRFLPMLETLEEAEQEQLFAQRFDLLVDQLDVLFGAATVAADFPVPDAGQLFDQIDAHLAEPVAGPLVEVLVPAFRQPHFFRSRMLSQLAGAEIVARLRSQAELPEDLSALPKALVEDPLSGRPFRYVRAPGGAGFELYSLGRNGRDEGGTAEGQADDEVIWPVG